MGAYDNMFSNSSTFKVELDEVYYACFPAHLESQFCIYSVRQNSSGWWAEISGYPRWYVLHGLAISMMLISACKNSDEGPPLTTEWLSRRYAILRL